MANVATVAAYRERWNITGNTVIGKEECVDSIEQLGQWRRASSAVKAAIRLSNSTVDASETHVHIGFDEKNTTSTLRAVER
ncbi:MAG: hypothetical protein ACYCTG_13845 [Ferrimicrobium sp.]